MNKGLNSLLNGQDQSGPERDIVRFRQENMPGNTRLFLSWNGIFKTVLQPFGADFEFDKRISVKLNRVAVSRVRAYLKTGTLFLYMPGLITIPVGLRLEQASRALCPCSGSESRGSKKWCWRG